MLIARLLPFVSFDFVSYFAGLTSMSFKGFMIATGIGQLPATIVYSYVGGMLTGGAKMLVTALLILFALAALAVLARQLYREHASRGKEGADAATGVSQGADVLDMPCADEAASAQEGKC